jgi:wyosine [tRNA(Phe)-imidazoG37] synthetase (radical SAM superfamily)
MMPRQPFGPDDMVKTCSKLESGLFLGSDGLRSCSRGVHLPPVFCSAQEIVEGRATLDLISQRRAKLVEMLNDDHSEIDCKRCLMVERKRYGDIRFSCLGHLDVQHYTLCNLRCSYCSYARNHIHVPPQYDALAVLRLFSPEQIEWNAHVDFAGGEPTLLENLTEYLQFFASRRIRVLMHTNSVKYHQAIYDGLEDGSIYWVVTSLDAGTPSTFKKLRGADRYIRVLENLSRYAVAGSKGKGMLAVKYIFCESNCGEDDIAGFAYAMLALRPQQVWLTFDFTPMFLHQSNHDYSTQIEAYAKLYVLLKKHGMEPFHYYKEAIATVSAEGREIMDGVLGSIRQQSFATPLNEPALRYEDFRREKPLVRYEPDRFSLNPLRLQTREGQSEELSLAGKRVLLAPACPSTRNLLCDSQIRQAEWIGFLDRNPLQQGKMIDGCSIYAYEAIASVGADVILVAPPQKHRLDILDAIASNAPAGRCVAEYAD